MSGVQSDEIEGALFRDSGVMRETEMAVRLRDDILALNKSHYDYEVRGSLALVELKRGLWTKQFFGARGDDTVGALHRAAQYVRENP
ncbi:MAG TPA: hypothetical protein VL494_13895 [Steroidobacteraceae bacterium]|jgi:hypothetical protein|nr:hypothetical protein [Steroidobacteraceae bacterium]